jgi:prevent-host-death family protein
MAKQARGKAARVKAAKKSAVAKAKPAKRAKGKTAAKALSKFRKPGRPAKGIRKPRPVAQVAYAVPGPQPSVSRESYITGLTTFDASKARSSFSEIVNRASFGSEHIAVANHGDVKVVVIDRAEYERFRTMEDYLDGTEAMRALQEFEASGEKTISSADVLKRLGLK